MGSGTGKLLSSLLRHLCGTEVLIRFFEHSHVAKSASAIHGNMQLTLLQPLLGPVSQNAVMVLRTS